MEYIGKLYAKIGSNKYTDTGVTSDDYDNLIDIKKALIMLVKVKRYKERMGKDANYVKYRDDAWEKAKKLIDENT